jgi:histidinol phosphatase-like enzyme
MVSRKPKVICLCGSTRFADHHAVMRWELEKEGAIVLMINYLPAWYADSQGWNGNDHFGEKAGLKEHLYELHLRKIDMADEVMVINVGGYIGESTRKEIEYAEATGKAVSYMEEQQ